MSGLLDEFAGQFKREYGGQKCGVLIAVEDHPEIAEDIETLIHHKYRPNEFYPPKEVVEFLAAKGIVVKQSSVKRHRRDECQCHQD